MIERDGPALGEEPALGGEVAAEAAVAVEVVGGEVEEDGDVGLERAGELDLVGGELEDDDHAVRGRIEVEDAAADVAPTCTGRPAACEDMGGERGGRRLAVRAGDGDDLRARSNSSQSGVAKERKKRPMSLSTATPASQAATTAGCGAG